MSWDFLFTLRPSSGNSCRGPGDLAFNDRSKSAPGCAVINRLELFARAETPGQLCRSPGLAGLPGGRVRAARVRGHRAVAQLRASFPDVPARAAAAHAPALLPAPFFLGRGWPADAFLSPLDPPLF